MEVEVTQLTLAVDVAKHGGGDVDGEDIVAGWGVSGRVEARR